MSPKLQVNRRQPAGFQTCCGGPDSASQEILFHAGLQISEDAAERRRCFKHPDGTVSDRAALGTERTEGGCGCSSD